MRNRIAAICPCAVEYHVCREMLGLGQEIEIAGRLVSTLSEDEFEVLAVHAGPGKIQCASATQLVVDRFAPQLVIDSGAAGSLSDSVHVGDTVCISTAYESDICPMESFDKLSHDLTTHTILHEASPELLTVFNSFAESVLQDEVLSTGV